MPDNSYTLAEAAAKLGIREDTLTATLPDAGIDLSGRSPQTLTEAEYEQLASGFQHIKALHRENVE